jgi:hypothetical protein
MAATHWWREVWSLDDGVRRRYCGIAKTPDGYAVDVFEGDTCIESETFPTRFEAALAVDSYRQRYAHTGQVAAIGFTASSREPAVTGRN